MVLILVSGLKMKNGFVSRLKVFFTFRTIRSKIIIAYIVFSVVILFFINLTVNTIITKLEEDLISSRLISDINYIEDLISGDVKGSYWNIKDKGIYFGDVLIGDGTEKTANFSPFLEHERKTGTFAYVFKLDKEAELGYVEATETSAGYEEGHYLRIAGSTRSPEGNSIVGTYISKNVADALDEFGLYAGEAVVAGGLIYCRYETLTDNRNNIVGAIVVGRNITELKAQIEDYVNKITLIMLIIVTILCLVIISLLSKWISSVSKITDYLQELESGVIPKESLNLKTRDEMTLISESVNKMVDSMKENIVLREKSETDALTGLPNRFAYDSYQRTLYNVIKKKPRNLALEILDVDYFKEYNDNYGHQAGDRCIQVIAKEIAALSHGKTDIFCCRYGGDEFVIIYDGYLREEVHDFVRGLKERVAARKIKHDFSKSGQYVSISQGVCFQTFEEGLTMSDYFNKADETLYEVKRVTRNDYIISSLK